LEKKINHPITFSQAWYNDTIDNKNPIDNLINAFLKQGGRINKLYLNNLKRTPTLVYLNGWYRGRNIREAILRALNSQ